MDGREKRIYQEAAALWREVFHEPPPQRADGAWMLDMIARKLPEKPYERITSPYLRPSNISWPKRRGEQDA
jgi:hypothetical protein